MTQNARDAAIAGVHRWVLGMGAVIAALAFLSLTGCVGCSQGFPAGACPFAKKIDPVRTSSLSHPAISPDGNVIAFEFNPYPRGRPVPGLYDWRTGTLTRADRPANFSDRRELRPPVAGNGDEPIYRIASADPGAREFPPREEVIRYQKGVRTPMTDLHATLYDLVVSPDGSAAVFSIAVPSGFSYNDLDLAVLDLRSGAVIRPGLLARVRNAPEFKE